MFRIIILTILATSAYTLPNNLDERILGGGEAEPGQFPSQVALVLGEFDIKFHCGGCIITNKWVLTAAHCVRGYSPYAFTIWTGTNDLKGEGGDRYGVSKAIVHEDYDVKVKQHDLGLLRTITEILFGAMVQPIALNTEVLSPGAEVIISGWGYTTWPGTTPNKQQFIKSKIMRWAECAMRLIWYYPVNEEQICTYTRAGEGMCGGDSGSGVLWQGKLAGVVSWGIPCGQGQPDVHSNVSSHIDWIRKNTQ